MFAQDRTGAREIEKALVAAFTSFRYKICSSLFKSGHWQPSTGQRIAKISQASFYAVTEDLKSIGVIECEGNAQDRRKKECRLTPTTHQTFVVTIRTIVGHMLDHAEHRPHAVAPLVLLFLD